MTHSGKSGARLASHWQALSNIHSDDSHQDCRKARHFSSSEVASLLRISLPHLRKQHFEGKVEEVEADSRGRRQYSSADIWKLRTVLAEGSRKPRQFLPGRGPGDRLQVLSVMNFSDGGGHAATAVLLGQGLSLAGYRVLLVDLDPQALLTLMCGFRSDIDFADRGTLYDAVRTSDPVSLKDVIRKSSLHNLDLAPGGIMLSKLEMELSGFLKTQGAPSFDRHILAALQTIEAEYDIVLVDCPRWSGRVTLGAMNASTSMVIPLMPTMLEVASMSQCLQFITKLMATTKEESGNAQMDFLRFLIRDHDPSDASQTQAVAFLRTMLGSDVMTHMLLKSKDASDASLAHPSLFELGSSIIHPKISDRAMQSVRDVLSEVEALIQRSWGRK